jgi:hypothetical protein
METVKNNLFEQMESMLSPKEEKALLKISEPVMQDSLKLVQDFNKNKNKAEKEIFTFQREGNCADIRFGDLPKNMHEDDIIDIRREDSFYSENNSYDAYTELVIIREIEETDEEYQKRISSEERHKNFLKTRRYETYLKLKSEFENQKIRYENYLELKSEFETKNENQKH